MADIEKYRDINGYATQHNVELIAVSKTRTEEEILELYNQGHLVFGENRVQELVTKQANLPKNINWHLIGSLQKNKVKYIASFVDTIHSCDSLGLLAVIQKEAQKNNRIIKVLIQLNISNELSKQGFSINDADAFFDTKVWLPMQNVELVGLMGMASFTQDHSKVSAEFKLLKSKFDHYQQAYFANQSSFKEISMGMSGDYQLAIKEGSTMIRVGSLIFGNRY